MNDTHIFQIEIPKRSAICKQGNEVLAPGMEYYSILLPDEEIGYQRYDYCLACWEASVRDQFNVTAKTAWKAKVATKNEVEDLSLKTRDEKAFYLLQEALKNPQNENWAETFVLALYLARRRILYLRQEMPQEDGSILCVYEVGATEEMLIIRRKALTRVNIEEVQLKIAEKLKNKDKEQNV